MKKERTKPDVAQVAIGDLQNAFSRGLPNGQRDPIVIPEEGVALRIDGKEIGRIKEVDGKWVLEGAQVEIAEAMRSSGEKHRGISIGYNPWIGGCMEKCIVCATRPCDVNHRPDYETAHVCVRCT
jgi:hypothetical protein